jgi:hypothetical protein
MSNLHRLLSPLLLLACLPACDLGLKDWGAWDPCANGACIRTCAQLPASQLQWTLSGFRPADILNPGVRDQPDGLTALVHVGDEKMLALSGRSWMTSEDCNDKVRSVEWTNSNPVVLRLVPSEDGRTAMVVALQPGDAVVAADITFRDDSPPQHVRPWSFTQVGSGWITVVRVLGP